jgi:uncharacterized protein DUF541
MKDNNIVTTVDSIGVIEVPNDRATFTITIKAKSEQQESAKEQIKERAAYTIKQLIAMNMQLDGEIVSDIASYKLEHREGGERYPAGYQSIATISWMVVVDEKLDSIYQAALKMDTTMIAPVFSIKDRDTLLKQAAEVATTSVKERLQKECSLLDIDPKQLRILNWHFGYDGTIPATRPQYSYGMMGATGPQGSIGPIGLNGNFSNAVGPGGYQAAVSKLGSIYQELLDAKLNPGSTSVKVVVQASYVWNE